VRVAEIHSTPSPIYIAPNPPRIFFLAQQAEDRTAETTATTRGYHKSEPQDLLNLY
jgi:hypothetical protein